LPGAPLRVGNLDILAPFVDQIGALGASVSKVGSRNIPGSLNVPGENQYFQINRPTRSPIVFTVGKSTAYIDGNPQPLRAAPLVINGQIFLPIFSVAPLMGAAARLDNSGTLVLTPTIQSVELFPIKDTVAVTIQASAPIASRDVEIQTIKATPGSSPKVYLDFPGFSMGFDAGNSTIERMVAPGTGDVLRARVGMPSKFPDITRIVLDLKRPLQGMPQTVPDPTIFAFVVAPPGRAAATLPPQVLTNPPPVILGEGPILPPTSANNPQSAPATNRSFGPSLRGWNIVVDPGHGGGDTGARGKYSNEKTLTLDISRRLRASLQARGANVLMTRDSDVKPELQDRVNFANSRRADLFVSVHINASVNPNATGTQTFYHTAISQGLAREVQKELVKATGRPNRGITQRRFVVVRYTAMPSVLTETAFISNAKEEALLRDPNFRERVARGIAQGIANYVAIYGRPGLSG
jgi:N-acetylmuramoyl-L-alanine amidase